MGKIGTAQRAVSGIAVLFVSLLVGPLATPASAAPDAADAVQVYEQDVFVIVGSTLRHPDAQTEASAPLYSASGVGLDRTWGQWSAAGAASTARTAGSRTDVRLDLSGLVPSGVYSVFWGTLGPDSENPLCPGVERTLPLTGLHPDRQTPDGSSFVASPEGTAAYRGRVDGVLLDATQLYFSVIYHFDGQTYGSLPNHGEYLTQGESCHSSFGHDAMRQLLVLQKW